jgi:hypothetical protein
MFSLIKQSEARFSGLWTIARTLFLLSVVYAVIVDMPLALENILARKSRTPTYHFTAPEHALAFSTPSWIKLGKDVLFLLAIVCVLIIAIRKGWWLPVSKSLQTWLVLILLIALLAVITLVRDGVWITLAGIRSHLALLAFLPGLFLRKNDIEKIWHWLKYLMILQIGFSIWAAIDWDGSFSRHIFRLTGTFHNPNTLGLFGVSVLIFLFLADVPVFRRWTYWGAGMAIIVFSGSRTAIASAIFVTVAYGFMHIQSVRNRRFFVGVLLLSVPFFPLFLEWLSGRDDMLFHLFDSNFRLGATWRYFVSVEPMQALLGEGLGRYTNTLYQLQGITGIPSVHGFDNLFGNELAQGGLLLLFSTLAFVFSPWLRLPHKFLSLALPGVVLGASIGVPLWEVWPANILLIALYGYLYRDCVLDQNKYGDANSKSCQI